MKIHLKKKKRLEDSFECGISAADADSLKLKLYKEYDQKHRKDYDANPIRYEYDRFNYVERRRIEEEYRVKIKMETTPSSD